MLAGRRVNVHAILLEVGHDVPVFARSYLELNESELWFARVSSALNVLKMRGDAPEWKLDERTMKSQASRIITLSILSQSLKLAIHIYIPFNVNSNLY